MMTGADRADGLRVKLGESGLSLAWFAMGSAALLEIGAAGGFDAAVLDFQHGLWDRREAHLAVGLAGMPPLIGRVATNSPASIGEALDSGVCGVLVPLVETAEQAAAAVAATRFPPSGIRSGGGVRPIALGFAEYHAASSRPLVGIMIETAAGVVNAAAIAAVPGLDLVFIGTGDLALSVGCFPEADDRLETACDAIRSACKGAGVPCGIFTGSPEAAVRRLAEGYAAVVGANDIEVVSIGFAQAARRVLRDGAKAG